MRNLLRIALASLLVLSVACQKGKKADSEGDGETPAESDPEAKSRTEALSPAKGDIPPPEDVAAPPDDAEKTDKGVFYKVIEASSSGGDKPDPEDTVQVHYTGWTTDGKMFDSSRKRGKPTTFPLNGVIPGWTDGLQVMSVGDKTRFWIPEELAYKGKKGAPQGMLVFDVELLKIIEPPKTPENVAAPPANAEKTEKGVSYVVLEKGEGEKKPRAFDKVKVHYTGWTTDGKMFDSSVTKGRPAEFPLNGVIPGWTDGLQVMSVGDRVRFWIPEELAYKDKPGRPQGMLVFDIELLEITEMPEPPPVPKNVAKPPANAKKTEKGVSYVILSKGEGSASPEPSSKVKVHYTGWTTDGKMFDSSVTRGRPVSFPLGSVIPGWRDGLQAMEVGDKARLWIPEELAYKGKPGRPQGMLVFDVELLEILD